MVTRFERYDQRCAAGGWAGLIEGLALGVGLPNSPMDAGPDDGADSIDDHRPYSRVWMRVLDRGGSEGIPHVFGVVGHGTPYSRRQGSPRLRRSRPSFFHPDCHRRPRSSTESTLAGSRAFTAGRELHPALKKSYDKCIAMARGVL